MNNDEQIIKAIESLDMLRIRIEKYHNSLMISRELETKDIRINILSQFTNILVCYEISLVLINKINNYPQYLENYIQLNDPSLSSLVSNRLQTFQKNSYIYNLSSIIENFSRVIYKCLDKKYSPNISYYKVLEYIYTTLSIPKNDTWNAALILSHVRNCIHNNGVFTNATKNQILLLYIKE